PIAPEQAQFYISDPLGGSSIGNWLKAKYPVRIQVQPDGFTDYQDAHYGSGLRVTGDGLIWLDALGEGANEKSWCMYSGSLMGDPLNTAMKNIKINCVVPMDHRLLGYQESQAFDQYLNDSYRVDLGGPPLLHVDSPGGYTEIHQKNSSPASIDTYIDVNNTAGNPTYQTMPLTRYLPPGSEIDSAKYAAQRKLYARKYMQRNSSWNLIGIRKGFRAG
ncbi:unnamed protein product, partial [marine sediment metagenome]